MTERPLRTISERREAKGSETKRRNRGGEGEFSTSAEEEEEEGLAGVESPKGRRGGQMNRWPKAEQSEL